MGRVLTDPPISPAPLYISSTLAPPFIERTSHKAFFQTKRNTKMHTSIQHLTSLVPRNAYPTQTTHPTLPNQSRPDDQESSSSLTEAVAASYAAERGRGQANELTRSSFREFLRSQANTTVRLDTQRFGAYLFTTPDRATTFFLVPGRVPLALAEDIESDELLTSAVRATEDRAGQQWHRGHNCGASGAFLRCG